MVPLWELSFMRFGKNPKISGVVFAWLSWSPWCDNLVADEEFSPVNRQAKRNCGQ
jgi:hypothetical protein